MAKALTAMLVAVPGETCAADKAAAAEEEDVLGVVRLDELVLCRAIKRKPR